VNGMYLVSGNAMAPCNGLPIPLHICPTCGEGIKQTRGWTWINALKLFAGAQDKCNLNRCGTCPVANPPEKAGLLWIGEGFYKTPAEFMAEGQSMGFSRRISAIPRDFVLGETMVYFAHPKGMKEQTITTIEHPDFPDGLTGIKFEYRPAVFTAFRPIAIEMLVTESQSRDADFMAGLEKRKITPVIVPDNDPDHQGSVYDKEDDSEATLPLSQSLH
jgi:hypothetical protein